MANAIDPKKTISAVNAFISSTTDFLNNFSNNVQDKLQQVNRKIERMEVLVTLLEYKINSVPT